ncbi:testis-expressed protein 22 [Echinops telfairi]|uniref:Testis-expressed protein 22 n=1 Tax=Echinops telfairi TaxID=9371 RepID=A0AC55CWT6_ECHTE|nr:testis-expressed protein 22 [Echinops telfairi]
MDSRKHIQKGSLRREPETLSPPQHRQPSPQGGPMAAWSPPGMQSSTQQGLQTQDWVAEPAEVRRPNRHWSLSIDERRRRAMLGGLEKPVAGTQTYYREIAQAVSQMVSEDVDKDVLIPHPPRSAESTNAFHSFLARSASFWPSAASRQRANEAGASSSPPS